MESDIKRILERSAAVKEAMAQDESCLAAIAKFAAQVLLTDKAGGTVYSCGNGGSACDAMHFTEELIARFKRERRGIRAMHFLDPGTVTCWGNDYNFEGVFSRQVETFCTGKDLLVAISTSGNSANVVQALEAARRKGTCSVLLSGKDGGKAKPLADIAIVVPARETEHIQEGHITLIHAVCELVDRQIAG